MTRNIPKTNVEQTKGNNKFYLYLYPLGTQFKETFKKASNVHVAHVHPYVPMCELWVN
jgi:hypothetical protein